MWFFWAFFKGTYIAKCHKNHYVLPGFWPKWLLYARSPSCTEGWPQRGRRSVWGDLGNPLFLQLQHCKRLVFSYVYGAQVGVSPREFEDLHLVNIWKTPRFSYSKLYKCEAMRSTAKARQGSIVFLKNVWMTPVLDMLARPCISPMWLIYLGLARLCIPQMSGWHLCWICWPGCTFLHCV